MQVLENPLSGTDTISSPSIVLCADMDVTVVRYSLLSDSKQLFASKYLSILPSEEELAKELELRHVLEIGDEGGPG